MQDVITARKIEPDQRVVLGIPKSLAVSEFNAGALQSYLTGNPEAEKLAIVPAHQA